jgi:Ca2+-binding RTX toxin-like protein
MPEGIRSQQKGDPEMANINGTDKANTLRGTNSNDDIEGRGGNDRLFGLGGNDDIEGGDGNDVLDGGSGRNDLEGGLGNDVFIFKTGKTDIDDFGRGDDTVHISRDLGVDNFDELMKLAKSADEGEDVLIDFGKHELRFEDTRLSDLRASDFDFI